MKVEFEKLLRQKRLLAFVLLVMTAVQIYLTFSGAYDTFSGVSLDYFWQNDEYRQRKMAQETAWVDVQWIADKKAEYQAYIDAHRLSPEEVRKRIEVKKAEGFEIRYTAEEALRDPYDFEYAFALLPDDVYQSKKMEDDFLRAFTIYIPLAEDPVRYLHDRYDSVNAYLEREQGISYAAYLGYSEAQLTDYQKLIECVYPQWKLVIGYSLGWDVLCTVMQFLPFTLGMVLIVTLGDLFSGEERRGMVSILRSTKYGRASLLKRKLGAGVTVATVLWIFFQLVMLLTIALTYTLRGATCTVLLFNGKPSIYGLNWLTYYLLQCAYSYLGTLVFTLLICGLSCVLQLRLSLPLNLAVTLLTGIPMNHFCYADQAFDLLDKCRAMTPSQLMAAHPTLQVYQSYALGNVIIQLPYVTAAAILIESGLLLWFLHRREGEKAGK